MATATATSSGLREYAELLRRRSIYVVTIVPACLLLAIALAFWLRPLYQATATILLQASTVTKDVIQSTVTSDTDEQINIVRDRVLTPYTLVTLVRDYDPYPLDLVSSPEQKAQRVLAATSLETVDPVSFTPTSDPSNAFSLHYMNPDRTRAAGMTQRLAELFLTYNQRQRAQAAKDTAQFLQQQAAGVIKQISEVDADLARFKTTVGDALPELRDQNQGEIDRAEHNIDLLQQEIIASQGKESELSVELSQMSPNLITQQGDLTDVATLRANLAEAEQRYTPEHPEVIRLKRALAQLMAQNGTKPARISGSTDNPSAGIASSATNPQYVMTATELESSRRELASLQAQAAKQQQDIDKYEELLRRTPVVERSESEILRRRQSLQSQYQEIEDKLQGAQEAQSFEAQQRGDQFILLRPPEIPRDPISPNRKGIIALGLLLGLGLAGGAIAMAEVMDRNIRNLGDVPVSQTAPLLGTIPIIRNARDRLHRRVVFSAIAVSYVIGTLAVGAIIARAIHHT
ncbi:MAG TPA: hypothetical protein VHY19_16550 [Steroidobacteraceae bacterium]|jgi:uncharacterized protein involved in exopolysaccharide biosynthesis|nr:hypothetical protein [Steroidobacteraceae bacterium]